MDFWRWKNFKKLEIDCNCIECGNELWNELKYGKIVPTYFLQSMDALQKIREEWGSPLYIRSAHRCEVHNRREKGAKNSQHLKIAFDIAMQPHKQSDFINLARKYGFKGIGIYSDFVHIDMRETAVEWHG